MRSSQGMSAGELLRQANQLKRSGKLDEAIALHHSRPTTTLAGLLKSREMGMAIAF
ncbi:MAG: hypothetical protein P5702_16090 [Limnospira sp. PMC 1291.21]|uniref:hypothetical protein n=1 Tax=unclassified Limnospira TaxID=2642885 RepID=UPI0028E16403|nr:MULTISPECIES: hypothetical protein [unclassified Limnospira]MDT9204507.1 hypothetical protein [Limnospira sp. PMC 1243.20]MDT9229419.1 hypothetical protein [Limnospira sp. PMC 1242.20]MDT9239641.1 hypothetical protein [Limnospira sp. PMC 1261.20]MDT9246922.1 hypothetical protein [Limnospira sp. PMC 1249.20]MDT9250738.1 hypothetical protein [Limnospira sp. PMC 1280.21]